MEMDVRADLERSQALDPVSEVGAAHPSQDWVATDQDLEVWARSLKRVRTLIGQAQTAQAGLDLRALRQRVSDLGEALATTTADTQSAAVRLAEFRFPSEGASLARWVEEFLGELRSARLPVEGEFPRYQIFPLEVRIDPEGEQAFIGRRSVSTLRPKVLAGRVIREHQRMLGTSFNADKYLALLLKCADFVTGPVKGTLAEEVPLAKIYELLTLRSGSGSYSRSEFAFDIYRLRRSSSLMDGKRRVTFDHGKRGATFSIPRPGGGTEQMTVMRVETVGDDRA